MELRARRIITPVARGAQRNDAAVREVAGLVDGKSCRPQAADTRQLGRPYAGRAACAACAPRTARGGSRSASHCVRFTRSQSLPLSLWCAAAACCATDVCLVPEFVTGVLEAITEPLASANAAVLTSNLAASRRTRGEFPDSLSWKRNDGTWQAKPRGCRIRGELCRIMQLRNVHVA